MTTVDLAGTWRFRPEGAPETTIIVPGFWEAQGHLTLDGRATYERDIELDEAFPHAVLEFDAVADLCEVFFNDESAGTHEAGFTPFALDVSGRLRAGRNTVRVEVNDPPLGSHEHRVTPQGKQGWGNRVFPSPPSVYITYGGIWQPCRLVAHDGAYVDDLWCDMDPDGPTVGVSVRGEREAVRIEAFGRSVTIDGDTARFDPGAEAWSPERPVLHEVRASVHGHARTIRTGLRRVRRDGDDVLVNGRPYRMRSALHQGFWPDGLYAADAKLIDRDVQLALDAGLNTIRTHLKAFEPPWLDAADARGLLLHCDLPIGEPLRDASLLSDETFVHRCTVAAVEHVKRDRSRPSIVMWTLLNEVGLVDASMLDTDAYRSLVARLTGAVRSRDADRPIVENDWVFEPSRLVGSDVRTSHWYGRTTRAFLEDVDERLAKVARDPGPLYVSEFGEWGLPSRDTRGAFWEQDAGLEALATGAGWPGTYDELVHRSQIAQGWADRLQAERFRTDPRVHGFCLTEWTDVPHELNGLVSLRRQPKAAIGAFRPALADLAPIAVLDRFAYEHGEPVRVRAFVSNWSATDVQASKVVVAIGASTETLTTPKIPAGSVVEAGECTLVAAGSTLEVRFGDAIASYPLHLFAAEDGGATGPLEATEPVPTTWGPTPIVFTTQPVAGLPAGEVLTHQIFDCYPEEFVPGGPGPVQVLIPPPIAKWGAAVLRDSPFARTVAAGRKA